LGYVLAISAAVMWGLVQVPIKLARAPARVGLLVSVPSAAVVLAAVLALRGGLGLPHFSAADWTFIVLSGLFNFALANLCYLEAVQRAGITTAAPLSRLTPLIVVVAQAAITRTGLSGLLIAAAVMTCAGGVLCARGARLGLAAGEHHHLRAGMILAVVACLMWAAGYLTLGQISRAVPRLEVALYGLLFAGAVYWIIALLRGGGRALRSMSRRDLLLYGCHGVVSYAAAYPALFEGIRRVGVSRGTVIGEAWPAFAVLVGIGVFRERTNVQKLAGIALLIGSALLVTLAG
jgi:drug/metabolite transporter (DMT)-like permease